MLCVGHQWARLCPVRRLLSLPKEIGAGNGRVGGGRIGGGTAIAVVVNYHYYKGSNLSNAQHFHVGTSADAASTIHPHTKITTLFHKDI